MAKLPLLITTLGLFAFLIFSCDEPQEEATPPAQVRIVQKTAEDDILERGIDAVPEQDAIRLEWHPNTEKDLAGYAIYRSERPDRSFLKIGDIKKQFGAADTTFLDDQCLKYVRYYYYIMAYNESQQYGVPSDTMTYMLIDKPILLSPTGIIFNPASLVFSWVFEATAIPDEFIIRLQKLRPTVYFNYFTNVLSLGDDYAQNQDWGYDDLGIPTPLSTGTYRWRIDPIGSEEYQGAESAWRDFTVQ